jgi:D-alanyl-D-alanine carboxypeptidase
MRGRKGTGRRGVSRTRLTPLGWVVVCSLLVLPTSLAARWVGGDRSASGVGGDAVATTAAPGPGTSATNGIPSGPTGSTVAGLPACVDADLRAEDADADDWARTILDTARRLPDGYVPPDLESVGDAGFDRDLKVRALVIPDLHDLREAAADAGHPIDVVAAYRSATLQADLFRRRSQHLGYAEAITRTARAGHSEHQLGTTLDFKSLGDRSVSATWGSTPTGLWMALNAYRFGFVMSYPADATDRTCYAFEPWHFRYFGRTVAAAMHDSGLTTREFLWRQEHPAQG